MKKLLKEFSYNPDSDKTCFCSTVINRAQGAIDGKGNFVSVQILILCPALSFIRIIYAEISCCSIASHVLSC